MKQSTAQRTVDKALATGEAAQRIQAAMSIQARIDGLVDRYAVAADCDKPAIKQQAIALIAQRDGFDVSGFVAGYEEYRNEVVSQA